MRIALVVAIVSIVGCGSLRSGMRDAFAQETSCPRSRVHVHRLLDRIARVQGCGQYVDYAQQWSVSAFTHGPSMYGGRLSQRAASHRWLPIAGVATVAATALSCPTSALRLSQRSATLYDVSGCGRGAAFELMCAGMLCGWERGDVVPARE